MKAVHPLKALALAEVHGSVTQYGPCTRGRTRVRDLELCQPV
ncbi:MULTISPECIES: hypothetical protein [Myxococcus]|nr:MULTISPECIES: hypothetical protein [Myxococcus]